MSKKSKGTSADEPGVDRPIKLTDIESGLRSLKTDITTVKNSATGASIAGGLGIALVVLILAFIVGRARGQKKFAFVEIRRA